MLNIRCMWNVGAMASILISSFVSEDNVPPPTRCSPTAFYAYYCILHVSCMLAEVSAVWHYWVVLWCLKTFLYPLFEDLQLWYSEAVVFSINLATLWSMEKSLRNISTFHSTLRIFLQVSLKKEGNKMLVSTTDIIQYLYVYITCNSLVIVQTWRNAYINV